MNIISHSLNISTSLLPRAKEYRSTKNKFFHFAFGYHKNKLIAIGQNNPEKTNAKALMLAKRFNLRTDYPYLHAETDLISRLWGKYYIDSNLSVVVIRLNKRGELRNSKPCERCREILECLGINKLYWSVNNGFSKS